MNDKVLQSQLNKSRLDKFLLVVDVPPVMRDIVTSQSNIRSNNLVNLNSIQFSVYGSVIPDFTVPDLEASHSGQTFKVSSHSRNPYKNIAVNFTIDNRFNNYWFLYKWLSILNDPYASGYANSETVAGVTRIEPINYQTDFTIFAKDEFDQNVVKFTYTKAFPVSLGSIDYNYRESGEIETTFEFAFSQFFADLL